MPTVRVLSVSFEGASAPELRGARLDRPHAGAEVDSSVLPLVGWVLGRDAQPESVEVLHGERTLAVAPVRIPRPDLVAAYAEAVEGGEYGFRALVDVFELPPQLELELVAVFPGGARVPIGSIRLERSSEPGAPAEDETAPERIPSMRAELRRLILEAVGGDTALDPALAEGVRSQLDHPGEADPSGSALEGIDLEGKSVLDVAAGVGDIARAARLAGAKQVDGLVADPYLLRLAWLLNVFHGATRVSFFERDAAFEAPPAERYDVVLALGDLDAVQPILDRAARGGAEVITASDVSRR